MGFTGGLLTPVNGVITLHINQNVGAHLVSKRMDIYRNGDLENCCGGFTMAKIHARAVIPLNLAVSDSFGDTLDGSEIRLTS